MAATLMQRMGEVFPPHARELLRAAGAPGEGLAPADAAAAHALGSVGVVVLIGLPGLILASLVLEAPLAGPAFIALGYLASAHAIAAQRVTRAQAWSLAVFAGLTGWSFAIALGNGGAVSLPGLAAALLAPILAAAPAVARRVIQASFPSAARDAPFSVTPDSEAVKQEEEPKTEPFRQAAVWFSQKAEAPAESLHPVSRPACDIVEAIDFALAHAGRHGGRSNVSLIAETSHPLAVACDRTVCRRTLATLVSVATNSLAGEGAVRIGARRVRATVLIRLTLQSEHRMSTEAFRKAVKETEVEAAIDRAGGSLVCEASQSGLRVSIRLAVAGLRPMSAG